MIDRINFNIAYIIQDIREKERECNDNGSDRKCFIWCKNCGTSVRAYRVDEEDIKEGMNTDEFNIPSNMLQHLSYHYAPSYHASYQSTPSFHTKGKV